MEFSRKDPRHRKPNREKDIQDILPSLGHRRLSFPPYVGNKRREHLPFQTVTDRRQNVRLKNVKVKTRRVLP